MRKLIVSVIGLCLVCGMALPARADRLKELKAIYTQLTEQKQQLTTQLDNVNKEMLRIEGRFNEREMAIKEIAEATAKKLEEEKPEEEKENVEEE